MKTTIGIAAISIIASSSAFAGDYTTTQNERPLVAPAGAIFIGLGTDLSTVGVGVEYGVMEDMSVSLGGLGFDIENSAAMTDVTVGVGYSVMSGDGLDVAAGLNIPSSFGYIGVDMSTRYAIMDGLAIRTGDGLLMYTIDGGDIGIHLGLGLTYQVADNMHVDLDTNLVDMAGGMTISIADAQIINIGAGYNMDDMDFGLSLNNVTGGDAMGFGLAFAYRM
jgi:hypothetical protein